MKKIYFFFIVIVSITFSSCSEYGITSTDIEGEWKMYKIKYPNSYQFIKVTDNIYFNFKNRTESSGAIEIYSENSTKEEGEYDIEYGNDLSLSLPGNTLYSLKYEVTASVGVLKMRSYDYDSDYEFIFIRE